MRTSFRHSVIGGLPITTTDNFVARVHETDPGQTARSAAGGPEHACHYRSRSQPRRAACADAQKLCAGARSRPANERHMVAASGVDVIAPRERLTRRVCGALGEGLATTTFEGCCATSTWRSPGGRNVPPGARLLRDLLAWLTDPWIAVHVAVDTGCQRWRPSHSEEYSPSVGARQCGGSLGWLDFDPLMSCPPCWLAAEVRRPLVNDSAEPRHGR